MRVVLVNVAATFDQKELSLPIYCKFIVAVKFHQISKSAMMALPKLSGKYFVCLAILVIRYSASPVHNTSEASNIVSNPRLGRLCRYLDTVEMRVISQLTTLRYVSGICESFARQ